MTTLSSRPCTTGSVNICFSLLVLTITSLFSATEAYAIPSPELVLGSVSSMSQIAAVGAAMLSGAGGLLASRLGWTRRAGKGRYPLRFIAILATLVVILAGLNHWQWQRNKAIELARLQATLVRPAQFDGTEIKDAALTETSYAAQKAHAQGITTAQAEEWLASGDVRFFDIRETAEHAMGSLPEATHMRYPDFTRAPPVQSGERVVLFCHNGNRSSETCEKLAALGIDCRFMAGGIEKWIVEGRRFTDSSVTSLGDLRSIPEFENKSTLLSTEDYKSMNAAQDIQVVDTRYPGDFASGHLPGAINIPLRALTTLDLMERIARLRAVPTVAACYDRRSCFMAQVLGYELTKAGIPFAGRYTVPWEYFVPPAPKPHVAAWMAEQNTTLWQRAISTLATALVWGHERAHIALSLLILAVVSRLLILPVALKSERDQLVLNQQKAALTALKQSLGADPTRKARAIRHFYTEHGLTPLRNMAALLFLPVTMLGVSAVQQASGQISASFLWLADLGQPDPTWRAPALVCAIAAVYLLWAMAKTKRQAVVWLAMGVPGLFYLTMNLTAAANLYLTISLILLLVQRGYVVGWQWPDLRALRMRRALPKGVVALGQSTHLSTSGNKALRLSIMQDAQLPVPKGIVLTAEFLSTFETMTPKAQNKVVRRLWHAIGPTPCAVRSSASHEDGAEQSFAGVFDSVLNVTEDQLHRAIETVNSSFHATRAQSYTHDSEGHGNILIQQMIPARYAGVLFTQDPMAAGMMLLEWVEGVGEDLVSGRKTPMTRRFGRFSSLTFNGSGSEDIPFDPRPLLALGRKIETLFDGPQDIEWAWVDGAFHILQARDITTTALGSEQNKAVAIEWERAFAQLRVTEQDSLNPQDIHLEQDEMSEVLPRSTPLSFSLICSVWAPGGSLDLACRALGMPYQLPEGDTAHLLRLFGKTYVDVRLKAKLALDLTATREKRLQKALEPTRSRFISHVLPDVQDRLCDWQAIDYTALPVPKIITAVNLLRDYFVKQVYMEAEQINLLATYAMDKAVRAASGDPTLRRYLMQADLQHSPANLLAACKDDQTDPQARALDVMGHRAMFDYELATPRYREAPSLLLSLLDTTPTPAPSPPAPGDLPTNLRATLEMALAYQDLKERSKHEALRVLAELRRALLALGAMSGLDEFVFQLTCNEILTSDWAQVDRLHEIAQQRARHDEACKDQAPSETRLSLADCEQLSMGKPLTRAEGVIGGTCVAGAGKRIGRVCWVEDDFAAEPEALKGFQPGDILVCRMLNPAWLAQMQQAGAVLSEVGGWLSHMAIVAREKQILMLVGCAGLDQLASGQCIEVSDTGEVSLTPKGALQSRSA